MKRRVIRGISKLPERVGDISAGKIQGHHEGAFPVVCPSCKHENILKIERHPPQANVCFKCGNVRITITPQQYAVIRSALRVENFARVYSSLMTDEGVFKWLRKHVTNQRYRSYLRLRTLDMVPMIGGQKVGTFQYNRLLRYVMFICIPRNNSAVNILMSNMVDIQGVTYLHYPPEFVRIFGDLSHNHRFDDNWRATALHTDTSDNRSGTGFIADTLRALFGNSDSVFGQDGDDLL